MKRLSPFLVLLFPLSIMLRSPGGFPYPSPDSVFSDITITHYPNALFLKSQFLQNGVIPLWSPVILSGYPFAGNPLSGLWYPPGWLALIFPLPLGFNLVVALHLLLGGLGMYTLLRSEGLGKYASIFGALTFESMPKIFAHYGAGHLTLIYAVTWTPWLLWSGRKFLEKRGKMYFLPAVFLSLITLADPRWIIFAGLLWGGYVITCSYEFWKEKNKADPKRAANSFLNKIQHLSIDMLKMLGQIFLGILISSPLLSPLIEYTNLSTRNQLNEVDLSAFSLPTERLLGFLYPDFGGYHEYITYTGSAILLLVIFNIFRKGKTVKEHFWLLSGFIALLFSLGSHTPFAPSLSLLPGFNLLRVPSRALFCTDLCMTVAASIMIESLFTNKILDFYRRSKLVFVGFVFFVVLIGLGIWVFIPGSSISFLYGSVVFLVMFIWLVIRLESNHKEQVIDPLARQERRKWKTFISINNWYIGLLVIVILDFSVVNISLLAFRSSKEVFSEGSEIAGYIASEEGFFRVYSPSYSLPQSTAMRYGIELADGVDPLQLRKYVDYMEIATGVQYDRYSVTLPPYTNGNPAEDNRSYAPKPELLGQLNVKYIVSEFDLDVEGLESEARFGNSRIYKNLFVLPRAWVETHVGETQSVGGICDSVVITEYSPNRIELIASGPGNLVLSEISYPGWVASVDGERTPIKDARDIFRAIPLTEGEHQIVVSYLPLSVYLGLLFLGLGIFVIIFSRLIFSRQSR